MGGCNPQDEEVATSDTLEGLLKKYFFFNKLPLKVHMCKVFNARFSEYFPAYLLYGGKYSCTIFSTPQGHIVVGVVAPL